MLRFFKEYFSLTNNEQRGIISLMLLILFVLIGSRWYSNTQESPIELKDNSTVFASLYPIEKEMTSEKTIVAKPVISYFNFDPNTANKEMLIQLGLAENVASTLINFRTKGGRFYKKEDLLKVYGIDQEDYDKLKDYIAIPQQSKPQYKEKKDYPTNEYAPQKKIEPIFEIVELNTADSALLTTVKGIGPSFASRIIKYRNLLGGFVNKEQLKEVYGLKEEAYLGIAPQVQTNGIVKQIAVNNTTWNTLKNHPYIDSPTANIILNYKKAHGTISDFNFFIESKLISQEELDKITPYLSLEK